MPLNNLGRQHLTEEQKTAIDQAIVVIETNLAAVTQNLSADERLRFSRIKETNKLLVNKSRDYFINQPNLASPDVDWVEFEADYQDRVYADTRLNRLNSIYNMLNDFKILHDFDNYQDTLIDYKYSRYKSSTQSSNYSNKVEELKQFFPNTGSGHAKKRT
jgi:hypothetical protein